MKKNIEIIIRKIIAVLNMPRKVADRIIKAKQIVQDMTANANFPAPNPSLATVNTRITNFENAHTRAQSRTAGTVQARDAAWKVLEGDLHGLLRYVQGIADASPANAESIILSAGMSIKKSTAHMGYTFTAKHGPDSGSVVLRARAADKRASYEWQMGTDQQNWTNLPVTLQVHTTVHDLQAGSTVYFRYRAVTKEGEGSWSQAISIIIV